MATATETATETLRTRASEASDAIRDTADRARSELEPMFKRADLATRQMVTEYPMMTLLGAVAAGYVVGRMLAARR